VFRILFSICLFVSLVIAIPTHAILQEEVKPTAPRPQSVPPHGGYNAEASDQAFTDPSNQNLLCPLELMDQVSNRDNNGGWLGFFGGGTAMECYQSAGASFPTAHELESTLESTGLLAPSPHRPPGFLHKCLESAPSFTQERHRKALVSNYYYLMNRVTKAATTNYAAIAEFDRTLGRPPLHGVSVPSDKLMPGVKVVVENVQQSLAQCPVSRTGLHDLAEETREAIRALLRLNAKEKSARPRKGRTLGGAKVERRSEEEMAAKQRDVAKSKQILFSTYPWTNSPAIQKMVQSYEPSSGKTIDQFIEEIPQLQIERALETHLSDTRDALLKQVGGLQGTVACLHGPKANCMREQLNKLDEIPEQDMDSPADEARKSAMLATDPAIKANFQRIAGALDSASYGKCAHAIRVGKKSMAELSNGFALNVGLTVATMGAGALVQGSRAAIAAGTASAGLRASVVAAKTFSIGLDVASLGQGAAEAYEACLDQEPIAVTQSQVSGTSAASCQGNAIRAISTARLGRGCGLKLALAAAGLLPLTQLKGVLAPNLGSQTQKVAPLLSSTDFVKQLAGKGARGSAIASYIEDAVEEGEHVLAENIQKIISGFGDDLDGAAGFLSRNEKIISIFSSKGGALSEKQIQAIRRLDSARPTGVTAVSSPPISGNSRGAVSAKFPVQHQPAPSVVRTQAVSSNDLEKVLESGFQSRARSAEVPGLQKLEEEIATDPQVFNSLAQAQKQGIAATGNLPTPFVEATESGTFFKRAMENNHDLPDRPLLVVRAKSSSGVPVQGNLRPHDDEGGVMFLGGIPSNQFEEVFFRDEAAHWFRMEKSGDVWRRVSATREEVESLSDRLK